ncbi:cytoskeletal protein CcmA (bactofilin family) [Geothermobacter ehrlichii]|uniref:Cytoskeletal protein CcmA (Bactofilin family) n=1 Tax=Geothermobacter ehrlichii TaxID=213224 RepID=A0A5D3WGR1_9BACT|nr:polymer-forming cytoskeletal protein [Geothermobacter ehrlichii]TYO97658.1 cytoskeletal protein CcmA (bactofilin family) [Geothermobacter ehrlichii]
MRREKRGTTGMKKDHPVEKGDIKAFLGPGSCFEGKLQFDEIVRLDGRFKGEIASRDTLIAGREADIEAEVTVGTLVLSGRFKGNIRASVKVDLRAPARVEGNIETPVLVVEEGVLLNSTLQMGERAGQDPEKSE